MRKATHNILALAIAAIALIAASCSEPTEAPGQFRGVPDSGWDYGDTLFFETTGKSGRDIALSVRHADMYPYANIWLEISYPSADTLIADTVNVDIADPYGKWLGAGSGPSILRTDTIHLSHLPDTTSRIGIRHIMRVETLPSVEQIGVTFVSQTK